MTRLDDRLRGLDEVDVPDVWRIARDRRPQPPLEPPASPARRIGTIVVAFLIAAGAFAFAASRLGGHSDHRIGGAGTITRYRFDAPPQPIAVGEGAAWVTAGAGRESGDELWRIDADTGARQLVDVTGGQWPAVGGGSAWLLCNSAACDDGAVVQLDPASGDVVRTVDLPGYAVQVAGTPDGAWITTDAGLSFVTGDGELSRSFPGKNYDLLGSDGTSVWVSGERGLLKIDPETGEQLLRISSFPNVCTMEVAASTVWVASCDGGPQVDAPQDELMGVDSETGDVLFRRPIDSYGQMRFADGVLWLAANPAESQTIRIVSFDPRSGVPLDRAIDVPRDAVRNRLNGMFGPHVFFAVGEGALWVTDFTAGEVIRVVPPTREKALPPLGAATNAPSSSDPGPALPAANGSIVFSRSSKEGEHLFLVESDGSGLRQLTSGPVRDMHADWSPDGRRLVFEREIDRGGSRLYVLNVASGEATPITPDGMGVYRPAWSGDGSWIAFDGVGEGTASGIFVVRPDGSDLHRVTDDRFFAPDNPVWSADSSTIAFTANLRDPQGDYQPGWDVYLVGVDGSGLRNLTATPDPDQSERPIGWLPNGNMLVATSPAHIIGGAGQPDQYGAWLEIGLDGTVVRTVLEDHVNGSEHLQEPSLSPDGRFAVFDSGRAGPQNVWIVEVATGTLTQITTEGGWLADWQPLP